MAMNSERANMKRRRLLIVDLVFVALMALFVSEAMSQSKPAKPNRAMQPAKPKPKVTTDAEGRKWLGNVPYDVFFDDPLSLANDAQPTAAGMSRTAATGGGNAGAATPAAQETPAMKPAASSGAAKPWGELIPMELLQDEAKTIRNELTAGLKGVGQYNSHYKEIQVNAAVLAALAGIAQRHEEPVGWKQNAKLIAELSHQLTQASMGLGKSNFEASQAAFENLESVFSGSIPKGVKEVDDNRPFVDFTWRDGVMKRMELASEWMRLELNSEAKFKKDVAKVEYEISILTAMMTVAMSEGYTSADEDDYQKYAKALLATSLETREAARKGDYLMFRDGVDQIKNRCQECHANYGTQ